ncbi:d-lactate dehydrogenase [Pyrenophora seminiperda CCB06]|uniref:D-lactate dehydrogenase n=1 Tax=Pyrenophora seminiperda CCB06 TaxID=1302712 RepID=A0A3M7LYZ2_9PLEO|nr:d-lactate dehydrogenase [Pyrenophora seminiperda CCB06]
MSLITNQGTDNGFDETDVPSPQISKGPPRYPLVQGRLQGFKRVEPYMSCSSHQRSTMRSRCYIQLVLEPQRLHAIEEEGEDYLSPPSSADSLKFTMHCGVVKSLAMRRGNFLDDECEDGNGPEFSMTSFENQSTKTLIDRQYEDMFADAIWTVSPGLALTNPSHTSSSTPVSLSSLHYFPSLSVLEAFGIEIHNHLALIFDCMNNGRSHELPTLSNDLNWALNALASDYPTMTLLGTLGIVVEILVERMVASSVVA